MIEVTILFRNNFLCPTQKNVKVFDFNDKAKGYREGYKAFNWGRKNISKALILDKVSVKILNDLSAPQDNSL